MTSQSPATGGRRLLVAVAAALMVLGTGTPAWAHARLTFAEPAGGAVLTVAPATVTLKFSERLSPDFTTIVVSGPDRQRVAATPVAVDDVRGTVTLTAPLTNGVYTVAYRVVSVDGHTVQGSYPFTLADPNLPAAAPAPTSTAAADASASTGGGSTGLLLGAGAGGVVLVTVAGRRYLAGRRPAGRASH
ncbi:copper resistance CopC family protein [Actinoplanes utahensis]|uniref:CopC domain-containing protein n=1 Tax=Actinoplanes utahensis TaxID=1869 RepID=A0A0A6UMQ0_ACTUT|nr:copper resistance protein CopC [Actinoplanes utahensis]KHD75604.1 hypothetical protein MB27_21505 [Actinoplanes utahensis]GIF27122.1 hypothetical protein Aut01nite_01080 [Actinoplanes utahensis]